MNANLGLIIQEAQLVKVLSGDAVAIFANDDNGAILLQQVNCKGAYGSGFSGAIAERYPVVEYAYRAQWPKQLGMAQVTKLAGGRYVANLFSQDGYGRTRRYTNYAYLGHCLVSMLSKLSAVSITTAYVPVGFGCGTGGGDWNIVRQILIDAFEPTEITLCLVQYAKPD